MTEALVVGLLGLPANAATTSLADRIGLAAPLLLDMLDAEQISIEMRADGAEPR